MVGRLTEVLYSVTCTSPKHTVAQNNLCLTIECFYGFFNTGLILRSNFLVTGAQVKVCVRRLIRRGRKQDAIKISRARQCAQKNDYSSLTFTSVQVFKFAS